MAFPRVQAARPINSQNDCYSSSLLEMQTACLADMALKGSDFYDLKNRTNYLDL